MNQIQDILNSPCGKLNLHLQEKPVKTKKVIKARNDSKEVQWLHWQLKYGLPKGYIVVPELRLIKSRKYSLDFAVLKGVTEEQARRFEYGKENMVCAIEYQGGIFMKKSGHSNPAGATRDCDKSNLAQSIGWPYLTFTVLNYENVLKEVEKLIKQNL